ncbi:MAG TPA: hypothetical protein VIS99_17560 [Terrimicrobiaceae bacterium]
MQVLLFAERPRSGAARSAVACTTLLNKTSGFGIWNLLCVKVSNHAVPNVHVVNQANLETLLLDPLADSGEIGLIRNKLSQFNHLLPRFVTK